VSRQRSAINYQENENALALGWRLSAKASRIGREPSISAMYREAHHRATRFSYAYPGLPSGAKLCRSSGAGVC